jgi:hypothetical protein
LERHIREVIHRVGSFDVFRNIVKRAATSESSGKSLGFEKLKTMRVSQHLQSFDKISGEKIVSRSTQSESIYALQNMIRRVRDDIERKILGRDEETNIFKALN